MLPEIETRFTNHLIDDLNMIYAKNDLTRFLDAQNKLYLTAYSEIKKGKKETNWMWFIFPQIQGLGKSTLSDYYAVADLKEATEFLNHPILAKHLIEISKLLLTFKKKSAEGILGELDARKLHSSMSLFVQVENAHPVFQEVLDTFFYGHLDQMTLNFTQKTTVNLPETVLS